MALHRRRGQDGKRGWGLGGEHHGGRRMGRLRGGWEVKVDLTDIAERKRPQVFPFLPDLQIDRRRMVTELLGEDPAQDRKKEDSAEADANDNRWYDEEDKFATSESEVSHDSTGRRQYPPDAAPVDLEGWEEDMQMDAAIERKAAEYRNRKLPPIEAVPELSDDPRVRLAAQRNFTKLLHEVRSGKKVGKQKSKRELQRERQVRMLQRDYFRLGYTPREGKDDYMSKEEAREILDARDQEELYQFYCKELLPLALQSPDGPDTTMASLSLLKQVYTDERRHGGIDAELLYPDDPYAELKVGCDEQANGEANHPAYPRNFEYPEGDWSTRIVHLNPLMPAVNSKVVMNALKAANVTARKLKREQAKEQEEYRRLVVAYGLEEGRGEEMMGDDDTSRQRRRLSRWGTIDVAKLNDKLMELTSWACQANGTMECEILADHRGPLFIETPFDAHAIANISAIVEDGADVNYHDPLMAGWTPLHVAAGSGATGVVRALVGLGASVEATSENGGTPLHYAAFNDWNETVAALLELGASVDARNDFQQTPLHLAASFCSNSSALALLDAGADAAARCAEGKTPADMVADLDFSESKLGPWMGGLDKDRSFEWLLGVLREKEAERGAMQS